MINSREGKNEFQGLHGSQKKKKHILRIFWVLGKGLFEIQGFQGMLDTLLFATLSLLQLDQKVKTWPQKYLQRM